MPDMGMLMALPPKDWLKWAKIHHPGEMVNVPLP